jgi:hypothetical protein
VDADRNTARLLVTIRVPDRARAAQRGQRGRRRPGRSPLGRRAVATPPGPAAS